MTNNIELFNLYKEALNSQTEAILKQTDALQKGFVQLLKTQQSIPVEPAVQQPTTPEVDVNELVQKKVAEMMPELVKQAMDTVQANQPKTVQEPAKLIPPEPVIDDVIEDPAPQEHVLSHRLYEMQIALQKPCHECPFKDNCNVARKGILDSKCPTTVQQMKHEAMSGGEIDVYVELDTHTMKKTYTAYKNGVVIGSIPENKDNKTITAELEKYSNQIVTLSTQSNPRALAHSVFTWVYAEIVKVTPIEEGNVEETVAVESVQVPMQPMPVQPVQTMEQSHFYVQQPEPLQQPEAPTLDLGEMILPI
jgi:hypothetical protein